MVALRHHAEQRFTCQQCGRCCRRGWDIAVTAAEVEGYRRAGISAAYSLTDSGTATATATGASEPLEPFEAIPGHAGHFRIRKRADGACGFLSAENRCRIHEQLGGARKPLTCRLFPFEFHPVEGKAILTASFACPTIVANTGEPVTAQLRPLGALYAEWAREFPEPRRTVEFVAGRPLAPATLGTLREVLRAMLDRTGPDGRRDLRASVGRMAALVDDLTRHRVLKLDATRFAEYLELTGRYAAASERTTQPRRPSAVGRLLSRGFLFAVLAANEQVRAGHGGGLRLGLRARLVRLLAHTHGVGPRVGEVDLGAGRRVSRALDDPEVAALVHHYLRAAIEDLGTGRRPVVDELVMAVALLDVAIEIAAMRTGRAGASTIHAEALTAGLLDSMEVAHVEADSAYSRVLVALAGGLDALFRFASGGTTAEV